MREKLAGYSIRLMGVQAIVVIALSLAWGLSGFHNVLPVLLGGLVSMIPNTVFAYRFFASGHQGKAPQKVIKTFYLGEILKLATTAGLALWMLIQYQVAVLPFLTGLVGATLGLSLAPILVLKRAARVRPS